MKTLSLALSLLFLAQLSFSQKLRINEIDNFTGAKKVYTSYETFAPGAIGNGYEVRFCFFKDLGNDIILRLMVTYPNNPLIIKKGAEILVKTKDNIYTLYASESAISSVGGAKTRFAGSGALGIKIDAIGNMDFFGTEDVVALRINYTDGYIDTNPMSKKNANVIKQSYHLIKQEITK